MSSAILEILNRKGLGTIGYGEYHGSSDSVAPEFVVDYDKEMEGKKPYFLSGWDKKCEHHKDSYIKVFLFSNYGGGFYWPSEVCTQCRLITGIKSPFEPDYGYNLPTEDEIKFWLEFHSEGWPKTGDPRGDDALSA